MDLLARREHSRLELQHKLQQRVESSGMLEETLDQLVEDNLLSDERFSEAFIYSRLNKGYGPVRVKAELKARGVSSRLIDKYLDEGADSWLQQLEQVVIRKYGTQPEQDIDSRARQQRFLQQRGYSYEQINRVMGTLRDL